MTFPDLTALGVFALAAIALLLIPGPSVLYVVTQSAEQGLLGLGTAAALAKRS